MYFSKLSGQVPLMCTYTLQWHCTITESYPFLLITQFFHWVVFNIKSHCLHFNPVTTVMKLVFENQTSGSVYIVSIELPVVLQRLNLTNFLIDIFCNFVNRCFGCGQQTQYSILYLYLAFSVDLSIKIQHLLMVNMVAIYSWAIWPIL